MQGNVQLRTVTGDDLKIFFQNQLDPEANYMAAFTAKDPKDKETFNAHWAKIMADEAVIIRAILFDGRVAGSIAKFMHLDNPEVTYWLGKDFWGKGIATEALFLFIKEIKVRPLYAAVAKDNLASIRVLEKCGFTISGQGKGFSHVRKKEVEEYYLILKATIAN